MLASGGHDKLNILNKIKKDLNITQLLSLIEARTGIIYKYYRNNLLMKS